MQSTWSDHLQINIHDSWKEEYARIGGLYASWGAILVIFLFPTVIFSELHVLRDNNSLWLFFRLFPSLSVGVAYILYKRKKINHEVLLEVIAFSIFTSTAYRANCTDWLGYLVSFSTCFMASAILTILRPRILYINFVVIWLIHILFFIIFCDASFGAYLQDRSTNFFPVVGLVAFSLAVFRYYLLRSNFQQRLLLKTANEELKQKSDLISEQNEELLVQKEEIQAQRDAIEEQNRLLENKNRDILDSINYAQRIQQALLPAREQLQKAFAQHFVFFKPKDLVSGDFYWMQEAGGKYYLAVMDCTGHGVPGALMSMMGLSAINKVMQMHFGSAGEMLEKLDLEMQSSMQTAASGRFDGMDIALCIFDPANKTLDFAGANHNLVLFDGTDQRLIKGDRDGIGGYKMSRKSFQSELLQLKSGQRVYLYTDGFKDQFGGPDNKKYLQKRFLAFLQKIQELPLPQQAQALEEELHIWTADFRYEQVDDILVLGFEV